jgi:hypothetical protein
VPQGNARANFWKAKEFGAAVVSGTHGQFPPRAVPFPAGRTYDAPGGETGRRAGWMTGHFVKAVEPAEPQ